MSEEKAPDGLSPLESFGFDVRGLRRERRLTLKGLGRATGYSESYVSKVETGQTPASIKFAIGCDRVFGTGGLLARQLQQALDGEHPTWFMPYIQLERRASRILDYSTLFPQGLFQTEEYAHAVLRARMPRATAAEVAAKVAARMQRHEILEREAPTPPLVWTVLHESCLRTVVGGRQVMARQLAHLTQLAELPHFTLQLFEAGSGAPATGNAFALLFFNKGLPVLQIEGPHGGRPLEAPKVVSAATDAYDRLRADALGPDASVARIHEIAKEYAP
ncbi:helix-turn-helix domain-containing protein [Streptomyces yaizuensis]|uniref:Scr1 family TA system antitoxin-like transcriptional regulator n=1 Tax=Streptomyces yaizuensis TaxID=2989713 RepID=A0ABQ5NTL2_9ACTN|nr:helix-turn-helix transcriptional regulator [Streptomyces sp. YSPA8]GLF93592.1 Scr1 family TA system antitoxin-like transcriptional regulator [Streptomyces sp. YSPA8]